MKEIWQLNATCDCGLVPGPEYISLTIKYALA